MDNPQDKDHLARLKAALHEAAPAPSREHDEAVLTAAARVAAERGNRRRWLMPSLGLAATVLLSVGLLQTQILSDKASDNVQRSGETASVFPVDGSTVESSPLEFRWPDMPAASAYRITVFDDAARPLWQSDWSADSTYLPDADQLALLEPGQRYFWLLETQGGSSSGRAGPFWFSIQ